MICPHCGTENRDNAKFCRNCAKPLDALPAEETDDHAPTRESANAIESAVSLAESSDAAAPTKLEPLAKDAALQDRYTILETVRADADAIVYRARDALRCPNCGAENPREETFCQNCGRELSERGTVLIEERIAPEDAANIAPPAFVSGGRVYAILEDKSKEEQRLFPAGVRLTFGLRSDVGLVRGASGDPDEDSVFGCTLFAFYESVAQPTIGLFIVADGIGGSEAGEIASKKCAQVVARDLMQAVIAPALAGDEISDEAVRAQIQAAIQNANTEIFQLAQEKQNDMGTTITLALVINDNVYIANVGDSRTYLFSGGKLQQITRDHSVVAKLVELEQIKPEEVYAHPERNLILRSLGAKPELEADIFPAEGGAIKLKPGARLLLCCDGLWEMARDDGIEQGLLTETDPQKACDKLIAAANDGGGEDNISVIVVNVERQVH